MCSNKVVSYLESWTTAGWSLETEDQDEINDRVARNTLAFHGLEETPTNVRNYVNTVEDMFADGEIKAVESDSGGLTVVVA